MMASTNRQHRNSEILRGRRNLQDERLKRTSLGSGVASCSSDSKWCRVFDELKAQLKDQTTHSGSLTRIKLLKSDEPFEYRDILASCFEGTAFDGISGPIYYREIEWLEVNTGGATLEFSCQVDFEVCDGLARIYGYKKTKSQQGVVGDGDQRL